MMQKIPIKSFPCFNLILRSRHKHTTHTHTTIYYFKENLFKEYIYIIYYHGNSIL